MQLAAKRCHGISNSVGNAELKRSRNLVSRALMQSIFGDREQEWTEIELSLGKR
jgi:hypothetical protein